MFTLSLKLMLFGLIGVFGALAVLYFAVNIMAKIFPDNVETEE